MKKVVLTTSQMGYQPSLPVHRSFSLSSKYLFLPVSELPCFEVLGHKSDYSDFYH